MTSTVARCRGRTTNVVTGNSTIAGPSKAMPGARAAPSYIGVEIRSMPSSYQITPRSPFWTGEPEAGIDVDPKEVGLRLTEARTDRAVRAKPADGYPDPEPKNCSYSASNALTNRWTDSSSHRAKGASMRSWFTWLAYLVRPIAGRGFPPESLLARRAFRLLVPQGAATLTPEPRGQRDEASGCPLLRKPPPPPPPPEGRPTRRQITERHNDSSDAKSPGKCRGMHRPIPTVTRRLSAVEGHGPGGY